MKNKIKSKTTVAVTTLFTWIGVGTLGFHRLEDWTWIQSFYYSVVTITTVGYGDLVPTHDISRLFAAVYILIGVSIGLASLGIIGSDLVHSRQVSHRLHKQKKKHK